MNSGHTFSFVMGLVCGFFLAVSMCSFLCLFLLGL